MSKASKEQIAASKVPVQQWLDHRDRLIQAIKDHDVAGQDVIKALVETTGAHGPFRFTQGRLQFRATRASGGMYRVIEEKESAEH